jgi:hypothetical protein
VYSDCKSRPEFGMCSVRFIQWFLLYRDQDCISSKITNAYKSTILISYASKWWVLLGPCHIPSTYIHELCFPFIISMYLANDINIILNVCVCVCVVCEVRSNFPQSIISWNGMLFRCWFHVCLTFNEHLIINHMSYQWSLITGVLIYTLR